MGESTGTPASVEVSGGPGEHMGSRGWVRLRVGSASIVVLAKHAIAIAEELLRVARLAEPKVPQDAHLVPDLSWPGPDHRGSP